MTVLEVLGLYIHQCAGACASIFNRQFRKQWAASAGRTGQNEAQQEKREATGMRRGYYSEF